MSDPTAAHRRRYRLVLVASMALLGLFLSLLAVHTYRAEYARQVQLQLSRIAGIAVRIEEIAAAARARVIALRHDAVLAYTTAADDTRVPVPELRTDVPRQLVVHPTTPAERAFTGDILASPLSYAATADGARAWAQDYRAFRALWLPQAGLHAASRHVAISYIVSALTGASASYPPLPPEGLAQMLGGPRSPGWNPTQSPFLRRLAPAALPDRGLVWLPIYSDTAAASTRVDADVKGDGRVISLIAPVDVDGKYRAGVGVDIWAEEMAQILRASAIPDTALTLVDSGGRVISTTRADAHLTAGRLGTAGGATDAAQLLKLKPATLARTGTFSADSRLLHIAPIANTPLRLVGELRPTALRSATLRIVGPLIAGAALLYLLLGLALWYLVRRVLEPAFALAGHIQSLGLAAPPQLPGYWARVLALTQSAFAERRRFEAELAAQREALHQSEKMMAMGAMLAGVAHELNNPLSVVVGRSVTLAHALQGTPHAASIGKLQSAAERCSRIVKTFLAMARQSGPRRTEVDINALIESALDVAAYGLRNASVAVTYDLDPALPRTEADGDQIVQILINLIVNAQHALECHAGPRALRIATRCDVDAGMIDVTIADNGPGVPPELANRIFEPFFTTKDVGKGTGMGLAVSRGMAEAQDAKLELLPSDTGAIFRLRVPLIRPAGSNVAPPPAADEAGPAPALHALVVDDETEVAELIRESIEDLFATIDIRHTGADALAAIGQGRYDLVITDVRMPGMSGPELRAAAIAIKPALAQAFLFISGDVLQRDALRATLAATAPVLEKPFDPEELRAFVLHFLQERAETVG